jgi:hypothetical protein
MKDGSGTSSVAPLDIEEEGSFNLAMLILVSHSNL